MLGWGFQEQYRAPEWSARVVCNCYTMPEVEQVPCSLGREVWIDGMKERARASEAELNLDVGFRKALVIGLEGEELWLTWMSPRMPRRAFKQSRSSLSDGQRCTWSPSPPSFQMMAQLEAGHVSIQVGASTCCNLKAMEPEDAVKSLLAPLTGTCQYAQNGWWTYEICWPYHVRRLHFRTTGEPGAEILRDFGEGPQRTVITGATRAQLGSLGGLLGFFGGSLELRRTLGRSGPPQEVAVQLDSGDDCRVVANSWMVEPYRVSGVGGHFNPSHVDAVSGHLATAPRNMDACEAFSERYDGAVLLVKRGKCHLA